MPPFCLTAGGNISRWKYLKWLPLWFEIISCLQRQLTRDYVISTNVPHCSLGNWGNQRSRERRNDLDWIKRMVDHKKNVRGSQEDIIIFSRAVCWYWHRFPPAVRQNGSTSRAIITMTSLWARYHLKSPASRLFTQSFIQTQSKEIIKAPRHWPLCGEFTGDRRIPRTNGQLRGKCFHLMTSSCSKELVGSIDSTL